MSNKKELDGLDKFILENRQGFNDEEPDFGHFNRFADKLNHLHNPVKKSFNVFRWRSTSVVVSLFILVCSVGFLVKKNISKNTVALKTENIDAFNQQLSDSMHSTMNTNFTAISTNDVLLKTSDQVIKLEMEYIQLKNEYVKKRNEKTLTAIRANLKERLAILDYILEIQSVRNKEEFVHEQYLLNTASDCFCLPETNSLKNEELGNFYAAY